MTTIAHFGTFDVENYGDLLFTNIVNSRLSESECIPVSPIGGPPVWKDSAQSVGLCDLIGRHTEGVVIGGGNIIHPNKTPLTSYVRGGVDLYGYADLWIGAALAAPEGTPVMWNAPGVPKPIPTEFIGLVRKALLRSTYLSVRDEESRRLLLDIQPDLEISVVPDSAWNLPSLWSKESLDSEFETLTKGDAGPFFTIHVNDRYAKDIEYPKLASILDKMAKKLNMRPILIGIGPCHNDDRLAGLIASMMTSSPILVDRPLSTRQVCAAISRSNLYVGSSMHGYITAAAFGVPAFIVAKNLLKFKGVVSLTDAPETLVRSWKNLENTVYKSDFPKLSQTFMKKQVAASEILDAHWTKIFSVLKNSRGSGPWSAEAVLRYRSQFLEAACRAEARSVRELKEIANRRRLKLQRSKKTIESSPEMGKSRQSSGDNPDPKKTNRPSPGIDQPQRSSCGKPALKKLFSRASKLLGSQR
ncbi:polysaccharide pyruvyl transferase family protein [Ruegeria arenilitoris]|nr:polysaccharide pyruvyl transferase family protein [Ruegeria arenilitoris]